MIIRGIFLNLIALLALAACAGGSGRQGTQITVTGTGPSTSIQGGAQFVFVMTVTNVGPYDASNIKLVDNVGNQLKLISITCAAKNGATCPSTPSVEMTIAALPNGGVLEFSFTVQATTGASGTVSNTMTASFANEIDPTGASAAATATAVSTVTNVVVSGTGPSGTLVGGSQAVFVMTVTNNGPDAAGSFNVYDNVGSGLSLVSITCAGSGGAVCPSKISVLTPIDSLPAGGVLTFTVTTQIGQNVNGTVSNGLVVNIGTNPNQTADSFYATANVSTAVINVSGVAPPGPLLAGAAASFTMTVTNNGPGTAQSLAISNALTSGLTAAGAIGCTASGGATCPASTGASMTVNSLPNGGSLAFTVPFTVDAGTSGTVSDTMTVTSPSDPKGTRTATANVSAGNPANGTYTLFASNAKQYTLTLNIDAGTYSITGNGQTINRTFTADASGGGYTVAGTARFRVATNFIAGGDDFGSGVIPYVAARVFGSTVQQIAGAYDLMTLSIPASGPHVTYAGTARISGNTLSICQSASQVATPQNCGSLPSGSLQSYSLTVSSNVYTATNTSSSQTFTFQMGIAGATAALLSAGTAPDGSQQFVIGLPDSAAIAGGVTQGSSTTADWITMTLSPTSYAFTGQLGGSDSASLQQINNNAAPFSMLTGNRASDGAPIYVMQSYPFAIACGATGGAASGQLQVTVP